MIRRINRYIKNLVRPIRLSIGRKIFDKKNNKYPEFYTNEKLNMDRVKSILFLRYDGKIGDMVINTLMFREIKKNYSNIKIGVVARGAAKDIIKYNSNIDTIYDYQKGKEKKIAKVIKNEKYDVLIDFSETLNTNIIKFINWSEAKVNIGLDKYDWNLFDISYAKDNKKHITERCRSVLEILNIINPDLSYDIQIDNSIKNKISNIVNKLETKELVILNPYGASKHRCFSKEKILEIAEKVLKNSTNKLIFLGEKNKKHEIERMISEIVNKLKIEKYRVVYPELDGILEVTELITYAKFVITPDTSIVHIAVAKNIPTFAVYRLDSVVDNNPIVWGPNSKNVKQILSKDKPAIGKQPDINMFDIGEIDI